MLSRHGWTALFAAACAFAIGRVFGLLELYVLGAGVASAVIISLLSVRRRLPPVTVQRVARPAMVAVGEPARVDIRVTNRGRSRTPHLQLWEPVGANGGAPMQLASLAVGESASAAYRVPTARRGVLDIGPLRAQRRDVLGLCVRAEMLAGADQVLVVPQHVHLVFPAVGSAGRLGQHLRMKAWGQTGGEFHSQREYVPGDDLRRVNWKASARSFGLVVRETSLEGVRRCTVVLDVDPAEYDADAFEHAVGAAASVTVSAATAGIATRLVAPGIDLRGPAVTTSALTWLATAHTSTDKLDEGLLGRGPVDGIGLVVLITGAGTSAAARIVRAGLSPDESLIVATAREAVGGGQLSVDATSMDALVNSWNGLVAGRRASVSA